MKKIHQYIALIFTALFVLFAAFQYNDPDAFAWIIVYLSAASLSFLAYSKRGSSLTFILAGVAYLIGAIIFWPPKYEGLFLNMGYSVNIEEARESLGLFLCFIAMVYFYTIYRKKKAGNN